MFIDNNTDVFITLDKWGYYDKIEIAPLVDTLPTHYSYNILNDYLLPYIESHMIRLYTTGDIFRIEGVQFKVTNVLPTVQQFQYKRIGNKTEIYLGGKNND